jgi:hypothetical protein
MLMGCDIHAFIEIEHGQANVSAFAEFHFPRFTRLFTALAGVYSHPDKLPLYPARGLPESISYDVERQFYQQIVPDSDADDGELRGVSYITESEANELLQQDKSALRIVPRTSQMYLPDPCWHDPSWLTHQELLDALAHHGITNDELSIEFKTAMEAMLMLSKHYGTDKVRLVFWFDS